MDVRLKTVTHLFDFNVIFNNMFFSGIHEKIFVAQIIEFYDVWLLAFRIHFELLVYWNKYLVFLTNSHQFTTFITVYQNAIIFCQYYRYL